MATVDGGVPTDASSLDVGDGGLGYARLRNDPRVLLCDDFDRNSPAIGWSSIA